MTFELGVDELLGARVNRQDRHIEAGVEQAGEEAALVGGWGANEERKCACAERVKPTLTLRKPIEALGIDGVEETTGTVLLGVSIIAASAPCRAMIRWSQARKSEQSNPISSSVRPGAKRRTASSHSRKARSSTSWDSVARAWSSSERLDGELEAAAGFGGGAGCDQVFA